MPMEHISALQANGILHKHTMRDMQIYKDFLQCRKDPHFQECTKLRWEEEVDKETHEVRKVKVLPRKRAGWSTMSAYARCEVLSGYGDTVCRAAIRKMQTELPWNTPEPNYLTLELPKEVNETISQSF